MQGYEIDIEYKQSYTHTPSPCQYTKTFISEWSHIHHSIQFCIHRHIMQRIQGHQCPKTGDYDPNNVKYLTDVMIY